MSIDFTTLLDQFEGVSMTAYLPVSATLAEAFPIQNGSRRVICTLNEGAMEFPCALVSKGDGDYFIFINKTIRNKLKLKLGQAVQVSLRSDESTYGLPMPEELGELLAQDDEGNALFHALTPGKQRSIIHLISVLKSTDKRLYKAIAILDYLKANDGKLDLIQLADALKKN